MKNTARNALIASALAFFLGGASLISSGSVYANDRGSSFRYSEYGRVVSVRPVYQNVRVREPRQECWIETERRPVSYNTNYNNRSYQSSVGSNIIGGVIGNQLTRGNGNRTRAGATIAGAIIGSAVASESRGSNVLRHRNYQSNSHRGGVSYETVEVERCRDVNPVRTERRIDYYNVTYEYRGRTYTTQTQQDPGDRIPLDISVSPSRLRR